MAHDGKPWKRLGDGSLITQDPDEGLGHIVPFKVYLRVLGTLMALTVLTVVVAILPFSETVHILLALFIAVVKTILVVSFFMHLKFEKALIIGYAVYPLAVLILLIGGSLGDLATRPGVTPAGVQSYGPLQQPQDKVGPFIRADHESNEDEPQN